VRCRGAAGVPCRTYVRVLAWTVSQGNDLNDATEFVGCAVASHRWFRLQFSNAALVPLAAGCCCFASLAYNLAGLCRVSFSKVVPMCDVLGDFFVSVLSALWWLDADSRSDSTHLSHKVVFAAPPTPDDDQVRQRRDKEGSRHPGSPVS